MGVTQLPPRFMDKVRVDATGDCWLWVGARDRCGYGRFDSDISPLAHKFAWVMFNGPVPLGMVLDHFVCSNGAGGCVNPTHVRPVTRRENVLRSDKSVPVLNLAKTSCIHGHEFDAHNTYIKRNGGRDCRACNALRAKGNRDRRRAAKWR